jgi:hypothetical protein
MACPCSINPSGRGDAARVYWSYNCRYYGKLCENSLIAPSAQALNSNTEAVKGQLANSETAAVLDAIKLTPRTGFLQSPTVDVTVAFKGRDPILVDSIKLGALDSVSSYAKSDSHVAMFSYGSQTNLYNGWEKAKAEIALYALTDTLIKRKIVFECVDVGDSDTGIQITNLTFDKTKSQIKADILCSCATIVVEGMKKFDMLKRTTGEQSYRLLSGDQIELTLDNDFRVSEINTSSSKAESEADEKRKKAEQVQYDQCAAQKRETIKSGDTSIFFCGFFDNSSSDAQYWSFRGRAYTLRGDKLNSTNLGSCRNGFAITKRDQGDESYLIAACEWTPLESKPAETGSKKVSHSTDVEIYRIDLSDPLEFSVGCECDELSLLNFVFSAPEKAVTFELRTSGDRLKIEDRPLQIPRSMTLKGDDFSILKMKVSFSGEGNYVSHEIIERIQ